MDQNTKTTWIYLSIALILVSLAFMFKKYLQLNAGKKISANTGYAIGIYQSAISGGRPSRTDVYFTFEVNGEKLERMPTKGKVTGYDLAIKGNKYLVIYDTTNPENCQILFDYPIKDSTDFIRYLEEFKTKPLDFDKYF